MKKGDKVVVDLDSPGSSWHKAEGVLLEDADMSIHSVGFGKVKITKAGPNDASLLGTVKLLFNLTPLEETAEAVDGPAHYGGKDNLYEVIKVAEAWGFEKNAYLFNALKYLGRAGKKGSKVEDLEKLIFYVKREIKLEEAKQ